MIEKMVFFIDISNKLCIFAEYGRLASVCIYAVYAVDAVFFDRRMFIINLYSKI